MSSSSRAVHVLPAEHPADRALGCFRIERALEPSDFRGQRLSLGGIDDALRLAAADVEIEAVQTERVGACPGPVDVANNPGSARRLGSRTTRNPLSRSHAFKLKDRRQEANP